MAYGTLRVADTLEALRIAGGTVISYGEDRVWEAVNALLNAHNALLADQMRVLCEVTTTRFGRVGAGSTMTMQKLDETGVPQPQAITAGAEQGLPLERWGNGLQWTKLYLEQCSMEEFAAQLEALLTSDLRNTQNLLRTALFNATNYTFYDRFCDGVALGVKRLQNADSSPMMPGPNGETFTASSHTHYAGTSSFVVGDLTTLIGNVTEHYNSGDMYVYINSAQEATVKAFTGFTAYLETSIIPASTTSYSDKQKLDMANTYNRAIGRIGGAEVWIKPWIPASYVLAFITGRPPLRMRVRGNGGAVDGSGSNNSIMNGGTIRGNGDLTLVADVDLYPLRSKMYLREIGFGAWHRTSAAVLYTANATYASPTFT